MGAVLAQGETREVVATGGPLECLGLVGQRAKPAFLVSRALMEGTDCLGNQGWMGCMAGTGWTESLE